MRRFTVVALIALLVASCGEGTDETQVGAEPAETIAATTTTTSTTTPEDTTTLVPDEETDPMDPSSDSLVEDVRADLASRLGVQPEDVSLVSADEVVWNDGSLGCPEPDMMYTQALVDGFWIIVAHDGVDYDYRATATGSFRLCEGGGKAPVSPEV